MIGRRWRAWRWLQRRRYRVKDPGIDAFIEAVRACAEECEQADAGSAQFIRRISQDFANIRLQDWRTPLKFLRQISGNPPHQFGRRGFAIRYVDDTNPARHYTAFVFVGYWLPMVLGVLVLLAWEVLGFLRYGFRWSQADLRCGWLGLRHGRAVRRVGAGVLAGLIERELKGKASEAFE